MVIANMHLRELAKLILNYRGQRTSIVRRWVFDAMRYFSPSIAVERNGIRYYVDTSDRQLGRWVFGSGTFETDIMHSAIDILQTKLDRTPVLEGRTFIDIGANIGTSTISALRLFGARHALAIEPAPGNFRLLQCNIISNDLTSRVQALQVALTDLQGTASLELSPDNSGDNRLRQGGGRRPAIPQAATVEVATARFDDVIADLRVDMSNVGLVWMDTQGHEGHILAAAQSLLQSDIPIFLEYWPSGLQAAGGLSILHDIISTNYREVVDVRASADMKQVVQFDADAIGQLASTYSDPEFFTDILLLK